MITPGHWRCVEALTRDNNLNGMYREHVVGIYFGTIIRSAKISIEKMTALSRDVSIRVVKENTSLGVREISIVLIKLNVLTGCLY